MKQKFFVSFVNNLLFLNIKTKNKKKKIESSEFARMYARWPQTALVMKTRKDFFQKMYMSSAHNLNKVSSCPYLFFYYKKRRRRWLIILIFFSL